jgi:hypothetical protein
VVDIIPSTIRGINNLPDNVKFRIYAQLIPSPIYDLLNIPGSLVDQQGNKLLKLNCPAGSPVAEICLFHQFDFPDPVIYGQITDTLTGQIHILLFVINDPNAFRFDVDRMPDGYFTEFGIMRRNIPAEIAAMRAGLAPGQIRRGLRLLQPAAETFESFSILLGHDRYFTEPLFYHNAVILERAGFFYLKGKRLMGQIDEAFNPGGELFSKLDGSNPFRDPNAAESIRLRSWALHDGLMGAPFTDVTMYKIVGKHAEINTTTISKW